MIGNICPNLPTAGINPPGTRSGGLAQGTCVSLHTVRARSSHGNCIVTCRTVHAGHRVDISSTLGSLAAASYETSSARISAAGTGHSPSSRPAITGPLSVWPPAGQQGSAVVTGRGGPHAGVWRK